MEDKMLKIGDFSKLSRISIRMLRHYDEIGLIKPDEIDPISGYRYYNESQLPLANRIQALKDMGFGLSAIAQILEHYDDKEAMEHFLKIKYEELKEQWQKTNEQMKILSTVMKHLRKDESAMEYNVTLKQMKERYVASLRKRIPTYDKEGILWQELHETLSTQNVEFDNPSYACAVFYDEGYVEENPDVEIQVDVKGLHKNIGDVVFKTVPEVTIASATYQGSYEQLTLVNQAVAKWVNENGYMYQGPSFCIYHVSPAQTTNPKELVTEVCYPVVKQKNQ